MSNPTTIKLEFPGSPRLITIARKAVEGLAARTTLTSCEIEDLKIAVGEACSNAVRLSEPRHAPVTVHCLLADDHVAVEIHSSGPAEEVETKPLAPAEVEKSDAARLGFYLIDHLVDEWDMVSADGRTVIKLVKRVKDGHGTRAASLYLEQEPASRS